MKLEDWRREKELTLQQLGVRLGVTPEAAGRYCRRRIPRPAIMQRIVALTEGQVQPNDFYSLAPDALVASGVEP